MYKVICEMIERANRKEDYELIENVARIIDTLASTINAPSDWRNIGERLYREYKDSYDSQWIYDELRLWEYEDEY